MMRWVRAVLFLAETVLAAPVAYLLFLTAAAVAQALRRPRSAEPPMGRAVAPGVRVPSTRFLILVPAHNEEALLPATLDSLAQLAYPPDGYTVCVVADNCDDRTAEVARSRANEAFDVQVYERRDPERRGKGHALRWLLGQLARDGAPAPADAVVILDADTVVSPNFLSAMADRLARGERVIQAYYAVRDPQSSWGAGLRYAALAAVHYLRPSARTLLGGSTGLKGNGMVFATGGGATTGGETGDILRRFAWTNDLAEDIEYHMQLILAGERVTFAPEAVIHAEMPGSLRASQTQNVRWERGRLEQVRRYVPRLLSEAVRRRSFLLFDAAMEQLIPPFSVLAGATAALLALAGLARARAATRLGAGLLAGEAVYSLAALVLARAPASVYKALLYAPVFVAWKCWLYARVLLGLDRGGWVRTARGAAATREA